jgi:hypothetical protein
MTAAVGSPSLVAIAVSPPTLPGARPLRSPLSPPAATAMSNRGGKGFYTTPNGNYVPTSTFLHLPSLFTLFVFRVPFGRRLNPRSTSGTSSDILVLVGLTACYRVGSDVNGWGLGFIGCGGFGCRGAQASGHQKDMLIGFVGMLNPVWSSEWQGFGRLSVFDFFGVRYQQGNIIAATRATLDHRIVGEF